MIKSRTDRNKAAIICTSAITMLVSSPALSQHDGENPPPRAVNNSDFKDEAKRTQSRPESTQALIASILRLGEGSEMAAIQAWTSLSRRVDALESIQEFYSKTSKQNYELKWLSLHLIGKLDSSRAADFLVDLATRPIELENESSKAIHQTFDHEHEDGRDQQHSEYELEMGIRQWSAEALAASFSRTAEGHPEIRSQIDRVLSQADPKVASAAAVALFGLNSLQKSHRKILSDRSIPQKFRILTDSERDRMFNSSNITDKNKEKKTKHSSKLERERER